jgi:hypothetical protein
VQAAAEADRFGILAKQADDADLRVRDALAAAHTLVERRPDILGTDPASGLTAAEVVDSVAEGAAGARAAWDAWDGLRAVTGSAPSSTPPHSPTSLSSGTRHWSPPWTR